MKILVPCVIGTVLTSSMAGYALGRLRFPGKKLWFALTIGAMILPGHVVLIPLYLTYSAIGATNTYTPFYLAAWCGGGASNVFLMRQFMRTLPRDYDESAMIDGANRLQIFLKILVPLCAPIMITVAAGRLCFKVELHHGRVAGHGCARRDTLCRGTALLYRRHCIDWREGLIYTLE